MSVAVTAEEVGQIVIFVAPGFVARIAYNARLPSREPPEFRMLVSSVVASLPLVALANQLASPLGVSESDATDLGYVALLLGLAVVFGYLVGTLRQSVWVRRRLSAVGLHYQPESSTYAYLQQLPADAPVTIQMLDGSKLSGTPRGGPSGADAIAELYVTHPAWYDPVGGGWIEQPDGAVIVPLAQVQSVTLDRDPTRG